jgi:undecaprenyl-diphosphatase
MQSIAESLAQHIVVSMLCVAGMLLALMAIAWNAIERYGPRLWLLSMNLWNAFRASRIAYSLRRLPAMRTTLAHTMTMTRYLGIHALVSFALAIGAVFTFFELADEIGFDDDLAQFDELLRLELAEHASRTLLETMAVLTLLGNKEFLIPLGVAITIVLLMRKQRLLAGSWAFGTGVGALLNRLLKSMFERTRPIHEHGVVMADGWSFPSGHASGAMLVYGLLAYILVRHTPRAYHVPIAAAATLLIVVVGFSRVILQVHYLSDVLAGYASAAAWGALCVAGYESARHRDPRAILAGPS